MAIYTVSFPVTSTGLSLSSASFLVFKKTSDGSSPTNAAPSTITEIGHGLYKFTYTPAEDVVFVLDGGATITSASDRYVRGVLSPMDERLDATVSTRATQTSVDAVQATASTTQTAVGNVQTTVNSAATQAGLDAVNSNLGILDARIQTQQDQVDTLYAVSVGRWKIHTSGPDANRIVYYAEDGTTVVAKFDLKDLSGNPTFKSAFERIPV